LLRAVIWVAMILCQFRCKNPQCHKPIVLPRHTLFQGFAHPDNLPSEIPRVALVCTRCTTVGNYSQADQPECREEHISPSLWEDIESLKCVEESCQALVPLFVEWNGATTYSERCNQMRVWRWTHPLTCAEGHHVPKPPISTAVTNRVSTLPPLLALRG
jgi:hypothetical protein